ncbi:MAG: hypothetical protein KJO07_23790, partial [Deltaproteobacteria bacterium]|nr:hypothetical protein [Deltaproteobacteria bacterium]
GKTCYAGLKVLEGHSYEVEVLELADGWYRGVARDISAGVTIHLGDIKAPGSSPQLASNISNFTEYYGKSLPGCDAANAALVSFYPPRSGADGSSTRTGSSVGASACASDWSETGNSWGSRHSVNSD